MHVQLEKSGSLVAVGDAAAAEVVRRDVERHAVALEHADVELRHAARGVGQHLVPVLELHPVVAVGEHLGDHPVHLEGILLRHWGMTRGQSRRAGEGRGAGRGAGRRPARVIRWNDNGRRAQVQRRSRRGRPDGDAAWTQAAARYRAAESVTAGASGPAARWVLTYRQITKPSTASNRTPAMMGTGLRGLRSTLISATVVLSLGTVGFAARARR